MGCPRLGAHASARSVRSCALQLAGVLIGRVTEKKYRGRPRKYDVETHDQRRGWLEQRRAGRTYAEIGSAEGVPERRVRAGVERLLQGLVRESGAEVLDLELTRLDALQRAVWDRALAGDYRAHERALGVLQQRHKLLGLERRPQDEREGDERLQWERVRAWLLTPTPELAQLLAECGWQRSGVALPPSSVQDSHTATTAAVRASVFDAEFQEHEPEHEP